MTDELRDWDEEGYEDDADLHATEGRRMGRPRPHKLAIAGLRLRSFAREAERDKARETWQAEGHKTDAWSVQRL